MAKKGGGQPQAPDPAKTAAAQAAANKEAVFESARVNQINQVTPFGSVTYSGAIGSPERTQTVSLPEEQQAILEGQRNIAGSLTDFAQQYVPRVAQGLSQPFSTADIGVARPEVNDAFRNRIEGALFDRLNTQFDRDEDRLLTRLANQGVALGSEAYENAFDDFSRARTDARLATIGAAGDEAARQFGLESQSYNQALSDALLNRTQGLNEVAALLQGAPAIQSPTAPQTAQYQVAAPDIMGANALAYQGALNNYNQRMGQQNAMFGGLAGLGGALGSAAILAGSGGTAAPAAGLLMSDIRVKTDIRRVGKTDGGLPVYTFRYKAGGPVQMGVMAQEVEKVNPAAVHEIGGVKHVDYAEVA